MMRWQSFFTWLSCRKHPAADGTEGAMFQRAVPIAPSREPIKNDVLEDGRLIQNCNETSDTTFAASHSTFEPASVPPIESITADTDIRAFLAPGVPGDLARGALRRAWATDPKIRDFVGLADYDWDFNAPGSLPGFGSLEMTEELRQVAAQVVGALSAAVVPREDVAQSDLAVGRADDELHQNIPSEQEPHQRQQNNQMRHEPGDRATEQPSHEANKSRLIVRRRQGGALPK